MSASIDGVVHTAGDESDVLFLLPAPTFDLSEGMVFQFKSVDGTETNYKVEAVRFVHQEYGTGGVPGKTLARSKVYYGVSIVP